MFLCEATTQRLRSGFTFAMTYCSLTVFRIQKANDRIETHGFECELSLFIILSLKVS